MGAAGYWLVLVAGLLSMLSALQANLFAASRVAQAMSRDRTLHHARSAHTHINHTIRLARAQVDREEQRPGDADEERRRFLEVVSRTLQCVVRQVEAVAQVQAQQVRVIQRPGGLQEFAALDACAKPVQKIRAALTMTTG